MTTPSISDVEETDHPTQPTVAVRLKGKMADLDIPALFGEYVPEIMKTVGGGGAAPTGPIYLRSFAFGPDEYDLEIGIPTGGEHELPVVDDIDAGAVGSSSLPAGRVAKVTHFGTYNTLRTAYEKIMEWLGDNDLKPGIGPWESYVDDPEAVEDKSELRTEIFWPVA